MKSYFVKIYNLVKQDIKSSSKNNDASKKTKIKKILGYLGVAVFAVYLMGLGYYASEAALKGLSKAGLEYYFVIAIVVISYLLTFLSSFRSLMSNKNKDNTESYIARLPVSSRQRYIAKNITQLIYSYSGIALLLVIPLIYYGISLKLGALYFVRAILAILLLPVIPTIILFALMTVIRGILDLITKGKTDNLVAFLSMGLLFYVYYIAYFKMKAEGGATTYLINAISSSKDASLMKLPMCFTSFILGNKALLNLGIILGLSILLMVVSTIIFGKLYEVKKGILGELLEKINFFKKKAAGKDDKSNLDKKTDILESKDEKPFTKVKFQDEDFKEKKPVVSYIKREFSFFTRNTALAMGTVLMPILLPLIMMAVMGFSLAGEFTNFKNYKKEIYFAEDKNLNKLEDLKEKGKFTEEEFQKALNSAEGFKFTTKKDLEDAASKKAAQDEAQVKLSLGMIDEKIKHSKDKEEIAVLNSIKEGIITSSKKAKKDDPFKDVLSIISFENTEQDDKKIIDTFIKLQAEGKIRKSTDKERLEQEKDDKYKKYASFNLPTPLLKEYLETKEMLTKSLPSYALDKLKEAREKARYKDMPKTMQFAVPIFVTMFIIYGMQLSIFMFSKEKNEITFIKTIPISYEKQIKFKQLPGIILETSTLLIYAFIAEIIFNLKMYTSIYMLLGLIMSLVMIGLFNNIEILLDLSKPNFNWQDTNALAKKNKTIFIYQIIKVFIIGITIFLGFYLVSNKKFFGLPAFLIGASITYVILAIISEVIILKAGPRLFKKLSN